MPSRVPSSPSLEILILQCSISSPLMTANHLLLKLWTANINPTNIKLSKTESSTKTEKLGLGHSRKLELTIAKGLSFSKEESNSLKKTYRLFNVSTNAAQIAVLICIKELLKMR